MNPFIYLRINRKLLTNSYNEKKNSLIFTDIGICSLNTIEELCLWEDNIIPSHLNVINTF